MSNPIPGWTVEKVPTLGNRKRAGGKNFFVGRRAQVRGVPLPGGKEWGLLTTNELGDIRLYADLPTKEPRNVPLLSGDSADDATLIGWSGTGMPGQYRYMAVLPRPDGAWDLVHSHFWAGCLEHVRKHDASDNLLFHKPEQIGTLWGAPEIIDWRRDGGHDLLLGTQDGKLVRYARRPGDKLAFEEEGVPVMAQVAPIEWTGPIFPCVVDWDGGGRSDLLIGDGDGNVFLYRDVGEKEVAFSRPRQLVNAKGFIKVKGPASPTVMQQGKKRFLVVADGEGAVWSWPIERIKSYVTTDIFQALGGEQAGISPSYATGKWWMLRDASGPILVAAPERPVTRTDEDKRRRKPMVFDPPAPELSFAPPVEGLCEVHVTFRRPDRIAKEGMGEVAWTSDFDMQPMVKMRLSDEPMGMILQPGELHRGPRQEVFFKTADLTGKRLVLQQLEGFLVMEGGVPAYIESVRVTPFKTRAALKPRKKRVSVAGIADAVDWYLAFKVNTPAEVDEMVEQHRLSGMDLIYYKLGGGCWEYPSRIPEAASVVPDLPGSTEYDKAHVAQRIVCQEMINRVQLVAESCRKRGMQCYGWMRIQNHGERIHGKGPLDRFYVEHPEYLDKDPEGRPIQGKLCLGYPEVRAFHVKLIEEAMDLGCDGIMMDTMRHLPKVAWGDPVVEEFRRRYGLDMYTMPPFDARVMDLQIEVFDTFLREVRQAMKAKKPDAELHVRVCRAYPLMGCDPARWAREGIVEEVMIEDRKYNMTPDIEGLVAACKGTHCAASASFCRTRWGTERMPLHPFRIETEVAKWLQAGSKRIVFYETAGICENPEFSRAMRRINDPSDLPSRLY